MSRNSTTTFILEDQASVCTEESKEDTEAMFIDPISNSGYIIQKVRPRNTRKDPVIFKVLKLHHFIYYISISLFPSS